jgi:hypothetical protein
VSIVGWRVTSHEVNAPFEKWVGGDDWVKKSEWNSSFMSIKLTFVTAFHSMDIVMKQCDLEVAWLNDFLGSGHP